MTQARPSPYDDPDAPSEADQWFLPGPVAEEDDTPPPAQGGAEAKLVAEWRQAEAGLAAALARTAGRLGALDDRLRRGPEGWRHRLALIEAAELSWFVGDRVAADRLALWAALRLSGVQDDTAALARVGWAARRLSGGPGPLAGLAEFLGRHDPAARQGGGGLDADRFDDRAAVWLTLMANAAALHPVTRAAMGYHSWALAGLAPEGDRMEPAVTAARIAAGDAQGEGRSAVFAPVAMGGAGGLAAGGAPADRLIRWLEGMDRATLAAMRHLDAIEAWAARAATLMAGLSGRTPPALCALLAEWPVISAPMAEDLTGASRAAVQRNLAWMEARSLVREVTGQGRFRMWRAAV